MKRRIPKRVQHLWRRRVSSTRGIYDCIACHQWTANLPLYKTDVCEARDRRKAKRDRREDDDV